MEWHLPACTYLRRQLELTHPVGSVPWFQPKGLSAEHTPKPHDCPEPQTPAGDAGMGEALPSVLKPRQKEPQEQLQGWDLGSILV